MSETRSPSESIQIYSKTYEVALILISESTTAMRHEKPRPQGQGTENSRCGDESEQSALPSGASSGLFQSLFTSQHFDSTELGQELNQADGWWTWQDNRRQLVRLITLLKKGH